MTQSYAFAPSGQLSFPDLTNPSHFEHFFVAYNGVVHMVCLRLLKDRDAAEDACQETFMAAWRNRQKLQPNRAWLVKVATNKCLDELRRRSRYQPPSSDEDGEDTLLGLAASGASPESEALSSYNADVLASALAQLPWIQRVAIVLSDVEGWDYSEIALACEVSVGTVKSRIFRGRRALRRLLDEMRFFD